MAFDPKTAKPNPLPGEFDPSTATPDDPSGLGRRLIGDTLVSAGKGVIGLGEAAVGLANLPTFGKAGKALESIGYDPAASKAELDALYSPEQRLANSKVAAADGFVDTLSTMLDNPSTIAHTVVESVPSMLGGGAIGQAARKIATKLPAWAAGAIGEGSVGAGASAEGIRQQTEDGELTGKQVLAATVSGAGTGLIGAGGGKLAQKMGLADIDTALAQGGLPAAGSSGNIITRTAKGAAVEGVLQEMPQSAQEQAWQNYALDNPLGDGVGSAAAMGLLTGAGMGGGANIVRGKPADPLVQPTPTADNPAPTPVPRPDPDGGVLSRAANLLPAPGPVLGLPAPDTLYADAAGNLNPTGPNINVDGTVQPSVQGQAWVNPQNNPGSQGGPGMDQQAPTGPLGAAARQVADPLTGEVIELSRAGLNPGVEARVEDAQDAVFTELQRPALVDGRQDAYLADSQGNVQAGKLGNVPPANYVQGGRGMDSQAPTIATRQGQPVADDQPAAMPGSLQDMRADAFLADADGNVQAGKLPNVPPANYVQGGPGMDQQTPSVRTYKGLPAAKKALRETSNPEALEVVKVGPQTFAVQEKGVPVESAPAPLPVLQNRDRTTPASITQMREIAASPDYTRLGFSRDFANGAPVVEPGANVPPARLGRTDIAATANGRKIPVQYAVVEADELLPSHDVNGSMVAGYEAGVPGKSRAIAGNGRVAGISHAYRQGSAGQYRQAIEGDDLHGINPAAIQGMKNPVLVRIMPQEEVTQGIGDESNTTGVSALSGAEQAMNDSRRISIDDMEFSESGEISETTVRQFVQSMPKAEQGGLLDGSRPSRQAYDRAESAIFANAYESESLIRLQAQATDPEVRTVLSGLLVAAPKMARLKGAGAWDIRGLVVEAAEAAVNARRNGQTLEQFAQQIDLDRNPESQYFIELFAANIRSAKRIGDELSAVAELFYAEASKPEFDMLGAVPRRSRQDLLNGARNADTARTPASAQTAGNQAGPGTAAPSREGRDPERAEPAGDRADTQPATFQLDSYSEAELAAQAAAQDEASAQAAAAEKAAAEKAQADRDRNDFTLTGSDRPSDVAAARGQNDMFAPPTRGERKTEQAQRNPVDYLREIVRQSNVPQTDAVGAARGAILNPDASAVERQALLEEVGATDAQSIAELDAALVKWWRRHFRARGEHKAKANADMAAFDQQRRDRDVEDTLELGRQAAADLDAQAFISAPDGSLDFGEITGDMAKVAGRQAGKIRLQQGNESWGLQHIEQRHGAEIRDAGFADVPAFVADIAQHIDQVWKPAATRQLVALHKVGNNRMMFVELQPGKDEAGDFYTVNTAFTSRKAEKKGWKLLWEARAQASGESGNRPSFAVSPPVAGGEVTNPSSQSSEPSIAPPAGDKLFATLETKETDLGVALFSRAGGPIDPAGLSESSIVTGKAPENPISLEEAISAAEQFLADYNGNIELSYRIRKTQYELYGPAGAVSEIGVVKGAYHPGRGIFTLTADHLSSATDAVETLRHEVLGHYGLDTFSPADKQAVLDKILASKDEPSLKPVWDDIAVRYKDKSQNVQAEEVFAFLAQGERSGKEKLADLLYSLLTRLLRKVLGYKKGIITRSELLREIEVISKGIRNGSRQRQTFESETKQRRGAQTETPAFKRWFGDSKVVDAEGKPLVVYHGTDAEFYTFVPSKSGTYGPGVYFADGESDAANAYGANVVAAYISLNNPWEVDADPESDAAYREDHDHPSIDSVLELPNGRSILDKAKKAGSEHFGEELKAELRALGHDGVIATYPDGSKEFVVFSPEQIKSATGNNGDFDPSNPDIRYRLADTDTKGIPLFSAKAIAKKVMAVTGLNATVVNTEADLPADLQAQIRRDKATGRVAGVYHNGTAYLVAANLRDTKHAISVMLHEAIGHGGVKSVLGERIGKVMAEIYRDMPAAMRKELERRYAGQMASMSEADARVMIAEEYVAHLAETDPKNSLIERLVAMLRKFIRDTFGQAVALKWTRNDLVQLLAEARTAARNGGRGPGGAARMRETAAADALAALPEVDAADESAFVASLKGDAATRSFANALYKARGTESPFFKAWFGKSRMVNKQGQPIAFVHRSYGERDTFTDADLGKNTGTPTAALGHFLARKDVSNVERYGPVVEQFYIRMEKPKVITQAQFEAMGDWSLTKVQAYRKTLMEQGHDGLYIQGLAWPVVFEGKNIKAKRNQGTFDATASTRYSLMSDAADLFTRFGQRPADPNDPFAEENRRLREQDKSIWDKAKREFRRQFAPGGLLPDAVFGEKVKRDSEFQAVEFDVRHLARGLERAIKADFGAAIDDLPDDQMKRLADALAGKVDPSLPEGTKVAVVAMRQYIDSLSAEYIGILQQQVRDNLQGADAALIEKIAGNMGSYVHRSYQAFDDPKWFQKVPTEVVNAARHYLANGYMEQGDSKKEAYERAEVKVNEMLKTGTAYDSMESFIAEGKLGAKDLSVLIKRKSIAPEIRALLGEYSDPRLNFAKSATKMGRLIWNQRFLDRVRKAGEGVFLFEGKDRPAGATVQIAGEASDAYAPLNGLWTFPDVAQAFKDSLGKEQMSDLYRTIVRLNGMVKYGKTVLSPTTAMRNWQSAMFFSLANGHFDLTQMKHSWAALREQVTQNATGDDLTYLRKLKQLGVVYDTPYAGEMMALLNDARMDELLSGKSGAGFKWLRKINEVAQGFYSFGDDFWKIIGFENEKASLIKAGIPADQAEQMAAERIRNTYPTYSMVGKGINWLRRFPLAGTFVSFPAEIIRTSVNMLQLTAADLKSDNPGLQAIGRKRVVGMAMVSAGFYALAAMTAAAFGVGDDEEEAIRDLAAPWQRNSTFLYTGRDADGKLRYFDMSFLDPYGYWKRPLTAMLRDQPWEKAAASGIGDMLSPFLGTDIAAGAIFEVLANKKGSGGQVYQEGAGAVDQTTAIADHLRKALQPGFVSNAERLLLAGQGARREGSGQPYDMRDEVVSLLGWRASTLDTQTALYYRSFEFTDGLRDASKVLSRTLRSSNKVSDGDIRSARETAQTQYDQAFKEMGRLVNSARAAGMSNQQIAQTLKLSGVSQVNVMALLAGRVPPMNAATLQAQVKATQQARLMQGSEHAQEIARRFAVARQL